MAIPCANQSRLKKRVNSIELTPMLKRLLKLWRKMDSREHVLNFNVEKSYCLRFLDTNNK